MIYLIILLNANTQYSDLQRGAENRISFPRGTQGLQFWLSLLQFSIALLQLMQPEAYKVGEKAGHFVVSGGKQLIHR